MRTELTARAYAGSADLPGLVRLATAQTATRWPEPSHWHPGDLVWALYQNTVFDPVANLRLWADARGELAGFAFYHAPGSFDYAVRPGEPARAALVDATLAWVAARATQAAADGQAEVALRTTALSTDAERVAELTRHGFEREDAHYIRFRHALDTSLPEPALPAGFGVRSIAAEADYADRVAIHREVWHPSRVTLDAYRRLRAAPGYTPALDLVVVAPTGEFAAYCICWLDAANGVGLFEPVGTRPAYRQRGLGRAVLTEGLRRLREHGMRHAIVMTPVSNENAVRLYRSAGFEVVGREHYWRQRVPGTSLAF